MEQSSNEGRRKDPSNELTRAYFVALSAAKRHGRDVISRNDVVAVGVGERRVNGVHTGEPALKVFVPRKIPLSDLPADRVLPSELETSGGDKGLVDVEEMDAPV